MEKKTQINEKEKKNTSILIQPSSSPISQSYMKLEPDPIYKIPLLLSSKPEKILQNFDNFIQAGQIDLKSTFNHLHNSSPFQMRRAQNSETSSYLSGRKHTSEFSASYFKSIYESIKRPSLNPEHSAGTFIEHVNLDTGLSFSTVKSNLGIDVVFDPCAEEVSRFDWDCNQILSFEENKTSPNERSNLPSELVELLEENDCEASQDFFQSIIALNKGSLIEEEDSINEEGSIRIKENLRVFLAGHASKDKLAQGGKILEGLDGLRPEIRNLSSPLIRKMFVFEENEEDQVVETRDTKSKIKAVQILFYLNVVGFASCPKIEFSNVKGNSRAFAEVNDELSPIVSLFSSKVLKQVKHLNVKLLSCGYEHVALITVDGKILTWGYGASGCLGHDSKKSYSYPTAINSIFSKHFTYLECGAYHTAAVSDSGELYTWGRSDVGQLGLNNNKMVQDDVGIAMLRPGKVKWLQDVISAACGEAHTLALTQCGKLFSFGWNEDGQLGLLESSADHQVLLPEPAIQISCGALFSAALCKSGKVYTWGCGDEGQLGLGSSIPTSTTPVQVPSLTQVTDLICGENSVITLNSAYEIYAWGQGIVSSISNPSNFPVGSEVMCFLPHRLSGCDILHKILLQKHKL